MIPGWRLQRFETLASTSDLCVSLARAGEPARLAVLAARQTQARGSRGRDWTTLPGNLALSVLLRPTGPATDAGQWALLAAVALADSLSLRERAEATAASLSLRERAGVRGLPPSGPKAASLTPPADDPHPLEAPHPDPLPEGEGVAGICLKWPNDVMLGGKKLGGILIDTALDAAGQLDWLVIGFGANLGTAPGSHASLPGDSSAIAAALLARLDHWDRIRLAESFAPVRRAWLDRGPAPGTHLQIRRGATVIGGAFAGLDDRGALLLQSGGRVHALPTGEILLSGAG